PAGRHWTLLSAVAAESGRSAAIAAQSTPPAPPLPGPFARCARPTISSACWRWHLPNRPQDRMLLPLRLLAERRPLASDGPGLRVVLPAGALRAVPAVAHAAWLRPPARSADCMRLDNSGPPRPSPPSPPALL